MKSLPVVAFVTLLLFNLHLLSDAVQKSAELTRWFLPLLGISVLGLVALAVLLGVNVVRLMRRYRHDAAGSRLTGRMVVLFAVLSLVPASIVYYYSMNFLMRGIDSWFDVKIDKAMENALELNQASLGVNQRYLMKYTERLMLDLGDESEAALALTLDELRREAGAIELTLMRDNGKVLASSNEDPTVLVASRPRAEIMQQLHTGANYVGLVPDEADAGLQIRVVVHHPRGRELILQALYPTSEHVSKLSAELEEAYNRYKELAYLRTSLKLSFSLALFLVLMFSLLTALLAAFHTARKLVSPVARIAAATRAVAKGDYDQRLPVPEKRDELRFLVSSFNTMTLRLAQARDAAARSQRKVELQRAYLQTVLTRLSSGVMTFDDDLRLRTANPAAREILGVGLDTYIEHSLEELGTISARMKQFAEALQEPLEDNVHEWREEVVLVGGDGRQVLMCSTTPFAQPEQGSVGHVVLFDDITTFVQAQRDAAWAEVARRLAHEIKNPLTPIQLAAERLRRKYLKRMPPEDAGVLDRATHTIVQQVEAMKSMVDAFSDYARPPRMQAEPLEADALFAEVLDLYRSAGGVVVEADLGASEVLIEADPVRLRQVLHNLMKNALEALEGRSDGRVRVTTREVGEEDARFLELRVEDNGAGFDEELLGRLFEPYVTTKAKGTGLGLAIVKKIVEEHGGIIGAENGAEGASIVLRLPVIGEGRGSASLTKESRSA